MENIYKVLFELRTLFPKLDISIIEKNNKGNLLVNEKNIFKFEIDFLESHLIKFGNEAIRETTKKWAEYVFKRYLKKLEREKKLSGRPPIPLTMSQIKFAQANTKSNLAASRFLKVSYNTYKKYAKMYNLFDEHTNQAGRDISKLGKGAKLKWEDIFNNKHPNCDLKNLKQKLIDDLILEEKCEICGYDIRRTFDKKIALVLDFIDGNKKNMARENMRLICYNCKFNIGQYLGKEIKSEIKKQVNINRIEEEKKKQEELWEQFNEMDEFEQSEIDEIWDQFN